MKYFLQNKDLFKSIGDIELQKYILKNLDYEGEVLEVYPKAFQLKLHVDYTDSYDGEIIPTTIYVEEREWRPKYLTLTKLFRTVHTSIDVKFSKECGSRKGTWKGGTMGSDCYVFKVYHKKIYNKNKYEPVGKLLRVENDCSCFEYEKGYDWASLYILHRDLMENKDSLLQKVGVKVIDKHLTIDGEKVARIVEYNSETHHNYSSGNCGYNRTIFHATYDLLIDSRDIQIKTQEKLKSLVNFILENMGKECRVTYVYYYATVETGGRISFEFDNDHNYNMGSDWYVPSEKKVKYMIGK